MSLYSLRFAAFHNLDVLHMLRVGRIVDLLFRQDKTDYEVDEQSHADATDAEGGPQQADEVGIDPKALGNPTTDAHKETIGGAAAERQLLAAALQVGLNAVPIEIGHAHITHSVADTVTQIAKV